MLHSKLLTIRLGVSPMSLINRCQFVIETSANGSIPAASYKPIRFHHMVNVKATTNFLKNNRQSAQCYSICSKKHTTVSILEQIKVIKIHQKINRRKFMNQKKAEICCKMKEIKIKPKCST